MVAGRFRKICSLTLGSVVNVWKLLGVMPRRYGCQLSNGRSGLQLHPRSPRAIISHLLHGVCGIWPTNLSLSLAALAVVLLSWHNVDVLDWF